MNTFKLQIETGEQTGAEFILREGDNIIGRSRSVEVQLTAAEHRFAGRLDWWFQGRERFESLVILLHMQAGRHAASMNHAAHRQTPAQNPL